MSEGERKTPYVYQPYGNVMEVERAREGRLWGVGGLSIWTTITGLKKAEANEIVRVLLELKAKEPQL